MKTPVASPTSHDTHHTHQKMTLRRAFRLLRRLAVLAAAVLYMVTSIRASLASAKVLRGAHDVEMAFKPDTNMAITKWLGTGKFRHSPLVTQLLGNSTALRNGTLYVDMTRTSFVECESQTINKFAYSDLLTRLAWRSMVRDTAFQYKFLAQVDVITPIIDCSFTATVRDDPTITRTFYLTRNKSDFDDIYLFSARFSMQDYKIPEQNERGPLGVSMFTFFNDMNNTNVKYYFAAALGYPFDVAKFDPYNLVGLTDDGYWEMLSVPVNLAVEAPKRILTARRTGVYVNSVTDQANAKHQHWTMDTDPIELMTQWNWRGQAVLRDSWSWAHLIHVFFAFDTLFNLCVLFLVMARNLRAGTIWIGDAFVSVSTTLIQRGVFIVLTWIINKYWTLLEFSLVTANEVSGVEQMFVFPEIIQADLMTFYLCVLSLIGYALREKVDPALAMLVFQIAFASRIGFIKWFPSLVTTLTDFAYAGKDLGVVPVSATAALSSPMRLWTVHRLPSIPLKILFAPELSTCVGVAVMVFVTLLRKVYMIYHPEKLHVQRITNFSEDEQALLAQKRTLTLFEIATGAALQNRYGVVSDYDNCWYIKGVKYASADGIYCNGYVIANSKFLIATADLLAIIVMKVLRVRFQNIYVYEVDGRTVNQRAKLVYPNTLSWTDLATININVLS